MSLLPEVSELILHRGSSQLLGRILDLSATRCLAQVRVAPGAWYLQAGQGMGATLGIASEKQGYTVTDRATFLAFKKRVQLVPLVERDRILLNIYSVLEPNPAKFPRLNAAGGKAFADFMISKETQEIIRTYGVDKFGEPLFFPDAGKREESL